MSSMSVPLRQSLYPVKRSVDIDIARGIGILLVLYGHALELLIGIPLDMASEFFQWRWIYSFHMPVFFFISGMVHRDRTNTDLGISALSLVVLAYFMHIFGWSISRLAGIPDAGLKALLYPFLTGVNLYTIVVWFLIALALVQVVYQFIARSSLFWKITIWLLVIAVFLAGEATKKNYLYIATIFPALVFYALGQRLSVGWWTRNLKERSVVIALIALLISLILAPLNSGCILYKFLCSTDTRFAVSMASGNIGFVPVFFSSALVGIVLVLSVARTLAKRDNRLTRLLARMGMMSLPLILMNGFFLVFVQSALQAWLRTLQPSPIMVLLPFLLTIAQVMLLSVTIKIFTLFIDAARRLATWAVLLVSSKATAVSH